MYPASRGFFLASLLACTKSFPSLVFRIVSLFTSPRETSRQSQNTRDANDCQKDDNEYKFNSLVD